MSWIKDAVVAAIKEVVMPEIATIKGDLVELKTGPAAVNVRIDDVNKRLDDTNTHLVDQSRRIDAIRGELTDRIDDTNKRMDRLYSDLVARNDETNRGISRLYEVVVRRDEHEQLVARMVRIEQRMEELEKRMVA